MSDPKQVESFIDDYEQTGILSILKLYALKFELEPDIEKFINDYEKKRDFKNPRVYLR